MYIYIYCLLGSYIYIYMLPTTFLWEPKQKQPIDSMVAQFGWRYGRNQGEFHSTLLAGPQGTTFSGPFLKKKHRKEVAKNPKSGKHRGKQSQSSKWNFYKPEEPWTNIKRSKGKQKNKTKHVGVLNDQKTKVSTGDLQQPGDQKKSRDWWNPPDTHP